MRQWINQITFLSLFLALTGCGSLGKKMKSFLGGSEAPATQNKSSSGKAKFSENANMNANDNGRLYRRVNKEIFEKEGMLDDRAGSLWPMEGQTAYLFSQNTNRLTGDIVNIDLEGSPKTQLEKKVEIIKSLLEKNRKSQRTLAAQQPAEGAPEAKDGEKKAPEAKGAAAKADPAEKQEEAEEKASQFDVARIPSRIIEQSSDGSYRLKGSQTFMIGKREYKVIATGIVRPSDIRDDAVQSSRILDSRFDIVSMKKEVK